MSVHVYVFLLVVCLFLSSSEARASLLAPSPAFTLKKRGYPLYCSPSAASPRTPCDCSPFLWLQGVLSFGAVLMSTVVLITQNRQDAVSEQRMQLDIQASLLMDQKISKFIEMVDEQRRSSSGQKPPDPQAEEMKEAIDPHQVISTLRQSLQEAEEAAAQEK